MYQIKQSKKLDRLQSPKLGRSRKYQQVFQELCSSDSSSDEHGLVYTSTSSSDSDSSSESEFEGAKARVLTSKGNRMLSKSKPKLMLKTSQPGHSSGKLIANEQVPQLDKLSEIQKQIAMLRETLDQVKDNKSKQGEASTQNGDPLQDIQDKLKDLTLAISQPQNSPAVNSGQGNFSQTGNYANNYSQNTGNSSNNYRGNNRGRSYNNRYRGRQSYNNSGNYRGNYNGNNRGQNRGNSRGYNRGKYNNKNGRGGYFPNAWQSQGPQQQNFGGQNFGAQNYVPQNFHPQNQSVGGQPQYNYNPYVPQTPPQQLQQPQVCAICLLPNHSTESCYLNKKNLN